MIYYYVDESLPLHALLIDGKCEQVSLNPDQKKAVAAFAAAIKAQRKKT